MIKFIALEEIVTIPMPLIFITFKPLILIQKRMALYGIWFFEKPNTTECAVPECFAPNAYTGALYR